MFQREKEDEKIKGKSQDKTGERRKTKFRSGEIRPRKISK
jgi:hypothetical protein